MTEPEQDPSGTATLPLFPLQTVLLPGTHLPLHIFEPRYRQLMSDLMGGGVPGREFGVIALRAPLVREVTGLDHVYDVGCGTVLREAKRLPDGRYDVVSKASRRFRLRKIDSTSAPYLIGVVDWLPDEVVPAAANDTAARLGEVARSAHQRYCEAAWHADDWHSTAEDADVAELAYQLAADCLLPIEDRQLLLEEPHPLRRLRIVCRLLTRETGFLSTLSAVPLPPTELADFTKPANLN